MKKWFSLGFWELIARVVLRNKILMLSLITLITIFLAMQWKNIHFTHTEANLLPADNIVNIEYNAFLNKFGEEGNLIVIGVKNNTIFTPKVYASWVKLMNTIKSNKDVDLVISLNDLKKLQKNETNIKLRVSGMPYIRTLNAQTILNEIGLFIGAALFITSLLFFYFFRSFRATMISLFIVIISVMWSFGILGLLNYEITVLTAMVPTLMIVIGIPNCIFLT